MIQCNVFDFHTRELIKEISLVESLFYAGEFIFWNSDILLIPNTGEGLGSIIIKIIY